MEYFLAALIGIPALFAAIAIAAILRGWAIHLLWAWFAVPVFGLPLPTIGQAIGLSMLIGLFFIDTTKKEEENAWVPIFFSPILTVAIAYIVKLIVM